MSNPRIERQTKEIYELLLEHVPHPRRHELLVRKRAVDDWTSEVVA